MIVTPGPSVDNCSIPPKILRNPRKAVVTLKSCFEAEAFVYVIAIYLAAQGQSGQ